MTNEEDLVHADTSTEQGKNPVKIIVCVKQVPAKDAPLSIAGNWIRESDIGFEMNEPDSFTRSRKRCG